MKYLVLLFLFYFLKTILADKSPKVIIIGCGAAGIAAASRLLANDINDVIILEAENRYGGRINTTKVGEYSVDLGAQWVHGEVGNVAYDLASPLGLLSKAQYSGGPEAPEYDMKFYESTGNPVSDVQMETIFEFMGELGKEDPDINTLKTGSVGEFMETRYNQFFKKHPEFSDDFHESFIRNLELVMMASDAAEDWYKLSVVGSGNYRDCPGYQDINWKEKTYEMILDILMKRYPKPERELSVLNKTLLNKKVSKISYGGDGPIRINTTDGSEYSADHVIFTPSLGVLKADHEKIFNPSLPEEKTQAIEKLGYGKHAKIVLYFDHPWRFLKGNIINQFLWTKKDRQQLEKNPQKRWMLGIAYDYAIEYKPKLYLLWVTGNYAEEMERIPEDMFKNQTMWFIRKFLGKTHNITAPREIRRSMWNTNENFRGSYSYESVEAFNSRRGVHNLEEPIMRQGEPVLQFAGEATNPEHYSTVHGAIETGWREADRLITLYKKKNV